MLYVANRNPFYLLHVGGAADDGDETKPDDCEPASVKMTTGHEERIRRNVSGLFSIWSSCVLVGLPAGVRHTIQCSVDGVLVGVGGVE